MTPPGGEIDRNPEGLSFRALVAEDFRVHGRNWGAQGFWALFWHRFGNWRMGLPKLARMPMTLLYRIMFKACEIFCGISIPYSIPVGRRVRIEHFGGIVVSAMRIGDDVVLRQNTTLGIRSDDRVDERPTIGDRVDIGVGAAILGGIMVGDDVVIGANAVVTRDAPAGAVVGGVPARVLRMRTPAEAGS